MLNRRELFLYTGALLASAMCPKIFQEYLTLWGDDVHDDTQALQAFVDGDPVYHPDGRIVEVYLTGKYFRISDTIHLSGRSVRKLGNSTLRLGNPEVTALNISSPLANAYRRLQA